MDLGRDMTVRQQQVARVLLAEISDILHTEMRDPRLGFVTLVDAEPSRDLRHARIHVSVLCESADEQKAVLDVLQGAAGYIRTLLGQRLETRYTPALVFMLDQSAAHAARVERILSEIAKGHENTPRGDG